MRGGGQSGRLARSLEAKIIRHLAQYKATGNPDWALPTLLEYITRVDYSLRRLKRRQLEMTLEKALSDFQTGTVLDEEAVLSGEDEDEEGEYALPAQDNNAMNKSVTTLWSMHKTTTPISSTPGSPITGIETPEASTPVGTTPAAEEPVLVDEKETKSKKRTKTVTGTEKSKRAKTSTEGRDAPFIPTARLTDLGGIDNCIKEIVDIIGTPFTIPEVYHHLGIQPPRGVLLHGPPGCGKTKLAHAIAGQYQVPFLNISAPSIVSGMSGESEKKIRDVFEDAKTHAPCILFIDEIDAITPKRETAQREMERRIVAQLLTCMDDLSWDKTDNKPVMIIGATNRPDSLDAALRRAGRFDREISMGVPDQNAREKILQVLAAKTRLEGDFDFAELAKATPGYVGADLQALVTAAGNIAIRRIFDELRSTVVLPTPESENAMDIDTNLNVTDTTTEENITTAPNVPTSVEAIEATEATETTAQVINEQDESMSAFVKYFKQPLTPEQLESLAVNYGDFTLALKKVQPSSKREGFATVPGVSWDDIGALEDVRKALHWNVVEPMNTRDRFERVGITSPAGVLLWGPPGCGKTLLAKAVANESNTNFISVKGPELLNKYVGESERGVRQVFARARASAPCVIFFDELDALCSRRDDQQTDASARVVNTLLTELDGVENRSQVYVIAATNRPDMIDPAMLRPGRLDKLLYVGLPEPKERCSILTQLTRKTPLGPDVSLEDISRDDRCKRFSGADLAALVRESGVAALQEDREIPTEEIFVCKRHFDNALNKTTASVLPEDERKYEALKEKYGKK
ncbi:P-loop containing nucleoside triphosphate hydrolase protein [Phycomyces nitens]|nr:P-loop containing nucleoside triphosphate hydrolase protein [Phycomyces nitens]